MSAPQAGNAARAALRRERAQALEASRPQVEDMSLLQRASVGPRTQRYYMTMLRTLQVVLVARSVPQPNSEEEWDLAVNLVMTLLFLDGAAASVGEKLLAAVLWAHPHLNRMAGGRMPVTRQALRGWRRVAPPGGRLPLPLPVIHMLVMWLLTRALPAAALYVLLLTELYLRPSEPLLLRPEDVIPGHPRAAGLSRFTSVLLHPFEQGVPSKSQEFDQSVMFDLPRHQFVATAVLDLSRRQAGQSLLLDLEPGQVRDLLNEASQTLQLEPLGALDLYRFRHSGASVDFALHARRLEEIQRRGRWRSARSVRRYEHGARLNELFARLAPEVRLFAEEASAALPGVLAGRRPPLHVPW